MNAEVEKTPEEIERLQRHQEEFEQLKQDRTKDSQDTFYDEIEKNQKKTLIDRYVSLRTVKAE